ncbi:EpsG family protein [uncultured Prevotella sp.]|uniref:EpsG family protein n=1 Tax=uncultured Prevotella sp. TaxID=159272 RepID=UPI0027E25927|nr:EpsG family protein [uncultured Prevotella sp.]
MLPTEQSALLVLLNIIMIGCNYLVLKDSLKNPYHTTIGKYRLGVFLCSLFCLFSFWGTDWFHYLETYDIIRAGYETNLENVYVWIIQNISPYYLIFRLIVWGSALCLLVKTVNNLSVSKEIVLLLFGVIYIIWFAYARATLAMVLAFYGYSLIVKNRHNFQSVVLGTSILLSSYFFHKTAAFAIGVAALALFLKRYPRYAIWILLITFPVGVVCAKIGVTDFMMSDTGGDGDMASYMAAGQRYMEKDLSSHGIGALLQSMLERIPYYLTACLGFGIIRQNKILIPNDVKAFIVLQILLVLISSIFAFNLGVNTSTIYVRFLRFAAMPTTIVMAYLYQSGYRHKYVKRTIQIAVCGTLYALLYSFYNAAL